MQATPVKQRGDLTADEKDMEYRALGRYPYEWVKVNDTTWETAEGWWRTDPDGVRRGTPDYRITVGTSQGHRFWRVKPRWTRQATIYEASDGWTLAGVKEHCESR